MDEPKKPSKSSKTDTGSKKRKESTGVDPKPEAKSARKPEARSEPRPEARSERPEGKSSRKTDSKSARRAEKAERSGPPTIREDAPARPAAHECPRCHVTLTPEKYEGVAVELCDTCWGYWLGRLELETILTSKDEVFSGDEKKVAGRAPAHEGDRRMLSCVRCGKTMSKLAVEDDGMVAFLVDYCRDHGLWLDTGEIKRAQILDERSGSVRKALRASFDRAALEADED
jgi:Zn-finger nucleic acid-binding protein